MLFTTTVIECIVVALKYFVCIYLGTVYIRIFDQKTWSQYNGQMGSEATLNSSLQFKIIVNNEL